MWSLFTIMPSKIGSDGKRMPLHCGPFPWPWWCVEAIHAASPNAACPGLHRKPLDAAMGRLLAPYRLGGRQGDSKHTMMYYVPTLLAILMVIAMRRYYTARIAQWRRSRALIKATKHHHWASTRSDSINRTCQCWLFLQFHREKGLELTCWPLITGCDISNW